MRKRRSQVSPKSIISKKKSKKNDFWSYILQATLEWAKPDRENFLKG